MGLVQIFNPCPNWLVDQQANLALKELHLETNSLRAPEQVIRKPHITQRLACLSPRSSHISCSLLWRETVLSNWMHFISEEAKQKKRERWQVRDDNEKNSIKYLVVSKEDVLVDYAATLCFLPWFYLNNKKSGWEHGGLNYAFTFLFLF